MGFFEEARKRGGGVEKDYSEILQQSLGVL
jgi:hypothetical protein